MHPPQEGLFLHWCISEVFHLTEPDLKIDPSGLFYLTPVSSFSATIKALIRTFAPPPSDRLKCTKILEQLNIVPFSPLYHFKSFTSFIRLPLPFMAQLKDLLVL